MKKKSIWIFLILLLILAALGMFLFTQRTSPENSMNRFLRAFQNQDEEGLKRVYSEDLLSLTHRKIKEAIPYEKNAGKDVIQEVEEKIFDFDYEIISCDVSGKAADVRVKITSFDLGTAYRQWYLESQQIKFSGEASSDKKNIPLRMSLFKDKIKEAPKTFERETEFRLYKKNGGWIVSDMGNAYEFLRDVSGDFIYS